MRYREEDLRRGTADVVTSGAGDIYFQADSFRARSGKRKSGLGLGLGLGEAGGYRLQVGRWMRIEDWGLRIGGWRYRDWETDRKSTRLNSSH